MFDVVIYSVLGCFLLVYSFEPDAGGDFGKPSAGEDCGMADGVVFLTCHRISYLFFFGRIVSGNIL